MITVISVDICESRKMFKELCAHAVLQCLNDFYQNTIPVLLSHEFLLEKYTGDGFIGCSQFDRHLDAVDCAKAIRDASPYTVRIGVATGNGFVDYVGWSDMKHLQAIGDAIYEANRIRKICEPGKIIQARQNERETKSSAHP